MCHSLVRILAIPVVVPLAYSIPKSHAQKHEALNIIVFTDEEHLRIMGPSVTFRHRATECQCESKNRDDSDQR